MTTTVETVDAIVVGTRCAGNAASIALSERGLKVIGIDAAAFPSDTLSTHLLWPSTMAEIHAIGALPRVEAIGAPRMPIAQADLEGITWQVGYTPYDGIDFAMCVRRKHLDEAFRQTALAVGADLRQECRATALLRENGRVVGITYIDDAGSEHELRAPLVIGADGRKSFVAEQVGATSPYRSKPSGRACFFAYWSDPRPELRHIAAQWRVGGLLGTAFPCDDGDLLCLLQPPVGMAENFRGRKAQEAYLKGIEALPGLAKRLAGSELKGRVRSCTDIESYFRTSAGPGWALAGDAGHFKDPVTAQGIRDSLRYGRLLGEAVAPVLGADGPVDLAALDTAVRHWARRRELDCMEIYQWTNFLAAGQPPTPIEYEVYHRAAADPQYANIFTDVFSRSARPAEMTRTPAVLEMTAHALRRQGNDRREVFDDVVSQGRRMLTDWVERQRVSRTKSPVA
ncbi:MULTISPECIES: NAD(P)/FAD-dependent oxidoreductase [unclassified Gordonia (in: high G+C Gram-positive bacteria)]|uniref:NAD(P)/FAD-dependent oxidoreductase n=1 Tax=unclassified Gordonia (in: high G+C Gram-positive bacteria) TaxID=2657482 RepID=UPI0009AE9B75|nr:MULTISPECIES: NAD(P)/FAD-dependent oxidoreductase [unclassified Gordonia (in: high G+C Gram-positive bacteria)]MDF3284141.1 NAD(P)/FAD-dependent oxidoreductase [Gordonia sp. N1V]OPX16583.1 oxidoreductase [Gordonia sp. i37]